MNTSTLITSGIALGAVLAPVITTIINKIYDYKSKKFNIKKKLLLDELSWKKQNYLNLKQAVENYLDSANHVIAYLAIILKNPDKYKDDITIQKYSNGSYSYDVHEYNFEIEKFMKATYRLRSLISDPKILNEITKISQGIRAINEQDLNNVTICLNRLIAKKSEQIENLNEELRTLLK